jgi:glycosyltransferase involved in cell wall biosynthesis
MAARRCATVCSRSIASIIQNFEIVFVDDGSKDNTQEIVASWLEERGKQNR